MKYLLLEHSSKIHIFWSRERKKCLQHILFPILCIKVDYKRYSLRRISNRFSPICDKPLRIIEFTVPRSGSLTLKSIAESNQSDLNIFNMPTWTKFGNKYGPRWRHHHFCSKLEFWTGICFGNPFWKKMTLDSLGSIFC